MNHSFIKIKPLETVLMSGEKIIKARTYAYFIKAEALVREAEVDKKKADLAATQALLKAVKNGIAQGEEASKQQLSDQMLKVSVANTAQLEHVEQKLAGVVVDAVRKIIEDFDDNELALSLVRKGLKLVAKSQRVVVRVHPEGMNQLMQSLMKLEHNIEFLEVMPDKSLARGDCVLESDIGIVKASVEDQLQQIEKAIKAAF
ncbi:MAG: type III secretion system stator protein SctL [Cocleimonas sp.]|nr:type III secretion system stator protein SctL [Cocleimonas sp.]